MSNKAVHTVFHRTPRLILAGNYIASLFIIVLVALPFWSLGLWVVIEVGVVLAVASLLLVLRVHTRSLIDIGDTTILVKRSHHKDITIPMSDITRVELKYDAFTAMDRDKLGSNALIISTGTTQLRVRGYNWHHDKIVALLQSKIQTKT
jgi:hypothetical protein